MIKLIAAIAFTVALSAPIQAAEIKLLSTGLFRGVLPILVPMFEQASGHKVGVSVATPGVIKDKLLRGETFDVAFLPTNLNVSDIVAAGMINSGSRKDIARTSIGVAIRANALRPDLSTPEAVRKAIVAAKVVALTDPAGGGPIGRHVQGVAEKFGFGAELKSRSKAIVGGGHDVAEAVAKGQADLGITLASEIATVQGVEIAGMLPSEMQLTVTGYGVLLAGSHESNAAKSLIEFMTSQEAKKIMKEKGIEPL